MKKLIFLCLVISFLLSACEVPAPVESSSTLPTENTDATSEFTPAGEITIFAPSSTSSIPLILAVKTLPNTKLVLFTNHAQASAQFIKDENTVLVTGLSVGVDMFRNQVPIQVFNSSVSGLSYIVGCNIEVKDFSELKGKEVYIPFEGSPLEETTAYFVSKAGLEWKKDVTPIYAPFDTSTALIKQGQDVLVALGEPSVSALSGQPCFKLGPSYFEEWNKITGSKQGYPQVAAFAKKSFLKSNANWVKSFNAELEKALSIVSNDPVAAVAEVKDQFQLPAPVLTNGLERTEFYFESGENLKQAVQDYYQTIEKPLDESFETFFAIP